MRRAPAPLLVAALVLCASGTPARSAADDGEEARPVIYKWVDENGIAHYTTDRDRIPSNLRNRIREVPRAAQQAAAPSDGTQQPSAPAAGTQPPPASEPASDAWAMRDAGAGSAGEGVAQAPLVEGEGSAAPAAAEDPALAARRDELDARIAELEAELARDEELLKQLISEARLEGDKPAPLYGDPQLEELARRFPQLQAQIAELRAERRRLEGAATR